jgi:2-iminobutanoate/2-iminopropanoate deaminase
MKNSPIITGQAPAAIGPYSQGISAGEMVFVSGQIALTPQGTLVAGGIKEQTEQCLRNIREILTSAGLTMSHVVKMTVFMTDLGQFPQMNEVYAQFLTTPFPARATVQVSALPKNAIVEIDAIAVRP